MAAEGKAIICYRCNLFIFLVYFVSIDERPAMGSQPNLASCSEVVSINKCPQKFWGPSPKFRAQRTSYFWPLSSWLSHSTPHISGTKRRIINNLQLMCPLKADLLSVTFDTETAEIRWLILTHPMKIQHFPLLPGYPHKGHCTQANQMLEGLKGLLLTVEILGKFVPQNIRTQLKLTFLVNTFFATSALDTAYLRNETSHRQTKMLMSIYSVSPKRWPTIRDLWPRNGWDPLAHFDTPYENSGFFVIAGLPTQRPVNPGRLNFAAC